MSRYPLIALTRDERRQRAAALADDYDGVAHRGDLRDAGVSRADVRAEVVAQVAPAHAALAAQAA